MIKNLTKGLAVMAVMLTLSVTTFGAKAQAASAIDICKSTTLSIATRTSEKFCTEMAQNIVNVARAKWLGLAYNPAWPFITADGDYYLETKKAVTGYQFVKSSKGVWLNPDGIVGPKTWAALYDDCRAWRMWYCNNTI